MPGVVPSLAGLILLPMDEDLQREELQTGILQPSHHRNIPAQTLEHAVPASFYLYILSQHFGIQTLWILKDLNAVVCGCYGFPMWDLVTHYNTLQSIGPKSSERLKSRLYSRIFQRWTLCPGPCLTYRKGFKQEIVPNNSKVCKRLSARKGNTLRYSPGRQLSWLKLSQVHLLLGSSEDLNPQADILLDKK